MKTFPFRCKTCGAEATLSIQEEIVKERETKHLKKTQVQSTRKLVFKDGMVVSENCWQCASKK